MHQHKPALLAPWTVWWDHSIDATPRRGDRIVTAVEWVIKPQGIDQNYSVSAHVVPAFRGITPRHTIYRGCGQPDASTSVATRARRTNVMAVLAPGSVAGAAQEAPVSAIVQRQP